MATASALRAQIEAALADRIPSALTPAPRVVRPVAPTGIASVDALLEGGLPVGAITEFVGRECSGRTSLALSFVAQTTQAGKVCAWIDVSNAFDPESAAAAGVDLESLLWVRCGGGADSIAQHSSRNSFALPGKYLVPKPGIKGLHGGGCGPHPRGEVKGLSDAVGNFLRPDATDPDAMSPRCAEPQPRVATQKELFEPGSMEAGPQGTPRLPAFRDKRNASERPLSTIDRALRVTDLLLQGGGFGAIVLDMGSIAPEHASRVPLATWFRYRAAAERSQASILLLTQHGCAKSSAGLLLRMEPGAELREEPTLFTGMEHRVAVSRERFQPSSEKPAPRKPAQDAVVPIRKPPQSVSGASWKSRTVWTGSR